MNNKPWGIMVGIRPSKELNSMRDKGLGFNEAFTKMHAEQKISKEKFSLLWRVTEAERPILQKFARPGLFSVYVGIPFCPTRCLYCSFPSHSLAELGKLRNSFVDSLLYEIEKTGSQMQKLGMKPVTYYIGGGTPTALEPEEMDRILGSLKQSFPGAVQEFTVEAGRPETVTESYLAVLRKHGVNRISVNPQTMHDKTLEIIGRRHKSSDIPEAVQKVRKACFKTLNMDLIAGLPGENTGMVYESVRQTLSMVPENITLHAFSRKRASRYDKEQENFILPDDKEAAAMHHAAATLIEKSYIPYYLYRQRDILGGQENIGYCLPGNECIYNILMIEERHHILGLGGGATSKIIFPDHTHINLANPKDVRIYMERLRENISRRHKN